MAWIWLVSAIAMEVVGTTNLKLSQGFTRLVPSVGVVLGYGAAFVLLAQALKGFEVGTAYALWSGIGTALIVLVGVVFLNESLGPVKIAGVLLVIGGVVLLNLSGAR